MSNAAEKGKTPYAGAFNKVPNPVRRSEVREGVWHALALMSLIFGAWYLWWRWTVSLNTDALWISLPLVSAETLGFFGLGIYFASMWTLEDVLPPRGVDTPDIKAAPNADLKTTGLKTTGLKTVDLFITTYNEAPELVVQSVIAAQQVTVPRGLEVRVHVLDDGRRDAMKRAALKEGCSYISRATNEGFKAGNLENALARTSGDLIVICDADSRLFHNYLVETLPYFADPNVAWVQTPHWFDDIPTGQRLPALLSRYLGRRTGFRLGRIIEGIIGPVHFGGDPFNNDQSIFFDNILRRRNAANAAFCCGAGSIHRRSALLENMQRSDKTKTLTYNSKGRVTPFNFHVSEDIFTSMRFHGDPNRNWKSVQHPAVLCAMVSPQDMAALTVQRFKYAGGSLDIGFRRFAWLDKGMSLRQRLAYFSTFFSYLSCVWILVFLLTPGVFLFTGVLPLKTVGFDFFKRFLPYFFATEAAMLILNWGFNSFRSRAAALSNFAVNLQALWTVLRGRTIAFRVTPKVRQSGRFNRLVWPQWFILVFNLGALVFAVTAYRLGSTALENESLIAGGFWAIANAFAMVDTLKAANLAPAKAVPGENGRDKLREIKT